MESKDAVRLTDRLHAEQGKGDPFAAAVRATRMPMIITDPRQDDNPIVFTNDAFLRLTGYSRDEIMGRNCRFLQGAETDQAEVAKLREAIDAVTDISVELLNYRKDGTPFWNALYLSPVFGESGELQFFFASQFDVSDHREREVKALLGQDILEAAVRQRTSELQVALEQKTILLHEVDHRVKNNLQMVAAMIRNQARFSALEETKEALHTTMVRVETLGTVHRTLYQSPDVSQIDVAVFGSEICRSIVSASGRSHIQVVLDMKPMIVSATLASTLALLINELMTNALKHAFPPGTGGGTITVRTEATDDRMHLSVTDDGVGTQATKRNGDTFGRRLIASLVRQLDGMIDTTDAAPGTSVSVAFPQKHGRTTP